MENYRKTQQAKLISQELQHIVYSTRQLALSSNHILILCGSTNGVICDNNWTNGALLFADNNRNNQYNTNEDRIIKYIPFSLRRAKLSWHGFSGQFMRFESRGITSASNGTFTYCQLDHDPIYSRQVVVSRGGRARLSKDKNNDGFHEDVSGTSQIQCL
jgi:type IV fimbrial biogenesis protein FimT